MGAALRARLAWLGWLVAMLPTGIAHSQPIQGLRVVGEKVELKDGSRTKTLQPGQRWGGWTLMQVVSGESPYAVFEDFEHRDGHISFVDAHGVRLDLAKTLESSRAEGRLYLGLSPQSVAASATDLLGSQILAAPGDPSYAEVAQVFPPIAKIKADTFDFLGAPESLEKIAFSYGGRTPNFDPAVYQPSIDAVRKAGGVWHGLVGGDLPVLRFVYPEGAGSWTELIAFAPLRRDEVSPYRQPLWYRVSRIENGALKWSRYVDSYYPVAPRTAADPRRFYAELLSLKAGWAEILRPAMQIELPDPRLANMVRFSLVRAIMTRAGAYPKYGVAERDYGGSEHDGFQDVFTVETTAMLEWGLLERAGRYIDNYLGEFVRDDGAIAYRGPELGQYGRMLTVIARYARLGGDPALLSKWRRRIDGITKLLLDLRKKAKSLPANDAAYGMIAGWAEADSCLEPDPARYLQAYFSNSSEAVRGLRELGQIWTELGEHEWGARLIREASELRQDLDKSIARSQLSVGGRSCLPAIAGAKEPFDLAVRRDPSDPQFRAYRAYNELMYSGLLSAEQVRQLVDYRTNHHDIILGVPAAYNKPELAGFLAYGYGYGLIQSNLIREALLLLYSEMAHQYTRGAWLAPETRRPLADEEAAPFCSPAQLVVPLLTRWLLVFEDPESEILWLGKGIPRAWLEPGKRTVVTNAPTRWGKISLSLVSSASTIEARLELPPTGIRALTKLRLRTQAPIRSVTLNGRPWSQFDPASETVDIPAGTPGTITIAVK
jgi:hypothetical protein